MHAGKSALALALALSSPLLVAADDNYVDVSLDPHGLGQGLMFPYFTTNNGQSTLLTVQNTSEKGKALKLIVRNAENGYDALSINLYLPPSGRWSAALTRTDAAETSRLVAGVPNVGCTLPAMPAEGFGLGLIHSGASDVLNVHEGSVDIVEMGTLSDALSQLAREGTPESCAEFVRRADTVDGIWRVEPNDGIGAPSGLLKGHATLLDVADGTAFSYEAPAFNGLAYKARHTTFDPDANEPKINFRPALEDIQTPPDSAGMAFTVRRPDGSPVTLRYTNNGLHESPIWGYIVIGSLLATTHATADVFLDPNLRARNEWIVSFPTYAANNAEIQLPLPPNVLLQPPFEGRGETLRVDAWDARGNALAMQPSVYLGKAVNIIRFAHGDASTAPQLASDDSPVIELPDVLGSVRLDFKSFVDDKVRHFRPGVDCQMLTGLPAWVMAVQSYDNDNAQPGRIATFPVDDMAAGPVEVIDCSMLE